MKINLNDIRITPSHLDFAFCVFGKPNEKISQWTKHWGFKIQESGNFTNILVPKGYNISQCFKINKPYKWLDGFSPNLNKHLHLGHFCNLVIAKSFQSLGVAEKTVAIFGDTLDGNVDSVEAIRKFEHYQQIFNYQIDKKLFASKAKLTKQQEGDLMVPGEGEYKGTMCFQVGENKIVGLKSDGSTTYFYQDIALAYELKDPYIVITGIEQKEHFENVKTICPWTTHAGIGLILNNGVKMSSRAGNVIMMEDVIHRIKSDIPDLDENAQIKVAYNVVAGKMLSYSLKSEKNIIEDDLYNISKSPGLYLSYAMARLKSAGCTMDEIIEFQDLNLQYAYLKAKDDNNPSVLLKALMEFAKKINSYYEKHQIKGNENNKIFFSSLLSELGLGFKLLGMFEIHRV